MKRLRSGKESPIAGDNLDTEGSSKKLHSQGNVLHLACLEGNMAILDTLVHLGADINAKDDQGNTPLYYAAHYGHFEIVEYLVAKGADQTDLLYKAAQNGQLKIITWFLGDINQRDYSTLLTFPELLHYILLLNMDT
jgi:ankyrin repeat protein